MPPSYQNYASYWTKKRQTSFQSIIKRKKEEIFSGQFTPNYNKWPGEVNLTLFEYLRLLGEDNREPFIL